MPSPLQSVYSEKQGMAWEWVFHTTYGLTKDPFVGKNMGHSLLEIVAMSELMRAAAIPRSYIYRVIQPLKPLGSMIVVHCLLQNNSRYKPRAFSPRLLQTPHPSFYNNLWYQHPSCKLPLRFRGHVMSLTKSLYKPIRIRNPKCSSGIQNAECALVPVAPYLQWFGFNSPSRWKRSW